MKVKFEKQYGQVEIGGKYAGLEFHNSSAFPSRISFYYPTANSIDLSTDYMKKNESFPVQFIMKDDNGVNVDLSMPFSYEYSPSNIHFYKNVDNYKIHVDYDFADDLPFISLKLRIENNSNETRKIQLSNTNSVPLRTCRLYETKNTADIEYYDNAVSALYSNDIDLMSPAVFIINTGLYPAESKKDNLKNVINPQISFNYETTLNKSEYVEIIQLIGMCRTDELEDMIKKCSSNWQVSLKNNQNNINEYIESAGNFAIGDKDIDETVLWSKHMIKSLHHYLDGSYLPMPCPAEYNFFFTHDFMVNGFGVGLYDLEYLRNGYRKILQLTKPDNILPHAYYYQEGKYEVEYSVSDNWNNLWIVISTSYYLKLSNDKEMINKLYPVINKSIQEIINNIGEDHLAYQRRPDWWDTGNLYGARAFVTILSYRALEDFVYLSTVLNVDGDFSKYLELAGKIKEALNQDLWSDEKEFILNYLESKDKPDTHYYIGSLLAPYFGLLDDERSTKLLETAKREMLDNNLGIRNAMPMDFHELVDVYKFNGQESGLPFHYFNGSVWPQGNIWYALSLIQNGNYDEAMKVLKKYMTLNGIQNSPNGQPAFYETRMTDTNSPKYGEIDKPTFLWHGGWFIFASYMLAGLKINSYNISFLPKHSKNFNKTSFDLNIKGRKCLVSFEGSGKYFSTILKDGKLYPSAVNAEAAETYTFNRGAYPEIPYIASAAAIISNPVFNNQELSFNISYPPLSLIKLTLISSTEIENVTTDADTEKIKYSTKQKDLVFIHKVKVKAKTSEFKIRINFKT